VAYNLGTRLAAAFFLSISFFPPWIHGIITFPIGWKLLKQAKQDEQDREDEKEHIKQLAEDVE